MPGLLIRANLEMDRKIGGIQSITPRKVIKQLLLRRIKTNLTSFMDITLVPSKTPCLTKQVILVVKLVLV